MAISFSRFAIARLNTERSGGNEVQVVDLEDDMANDTAGEPDCVGDDPVGVEEVMENLDDNDDSYD